MKEFTKQCQLCIICYINVSLLIAVKSVKNWHNDLLFSCFVKMKILQIVASFSAQTSQQQGHLACKNNYFSIPKWKTCWAKA